MSGETDLNILLGNLTAVLNDKTYVFVSQQTHQIPDGVHPKMVFEESEGTTLILLESDAIASGIPYEFPCRMITLNVHSSLEAVGFIAHIATALAAENMGVNPVSGFYHDHIFVPVGREQDALRLLEALRVKAQKSG